MSDKEVFEQKVNDDELENVSGGYEIKDSDSNNCTRYHTREIYGGNGYPNCAASVEDGSLCSTNDACYKVAVEYKGMTDCAKAWK